MNHGYYTYEDLYCWELGAAELLPETEYPKIYPRPKEMVKPKVERNFDYYGAATGKWEGNISGERIPLIMSGVYIPLSDFGYSNKEVKVKRERFNSKEIEILEREIKEREEKREIEWEIGERKKLEMAVIVAKEAEKYKILKELNDIDSISFNPLAALKYNLGIYKLENLECESPLYFDESPVKDNRGPEQFCHQGFGKFQVCL